MSRKLRERIKSLVIAALVINAIVLAYKSEVFNEFLAESRLVEQISAYFGKGMQTGSTGSGDSEVAEREVLVRPVSMAVVSGVGARCGAAYSKEQLESMYEKTVNIFGEALGSATVPEECSEQEWQRALTLPGVYWDYQAELPLNLLVKWLGMSMLNHNDDQAAQFVAAIGESGSVDVYYANSNGFYKCGSAAKAESIGNVMLEFLPNGAYFAFESDKLHDMVDPYTLIMPELPEKYELRAESIVDRDDMQERITELLGMNTLGGASYSEKSGTMVYVGVNGVLRISADGKLSYSVTDDDYSEEDNSTADDDLLIERACGVVALMRSGSEGIEEMYFSGVEKTGESRVAVSFDYYADGVRIAQKSGSAATVVYDSGHMVSLDIWLNQYSDTAVETSLLPMLQASAIAGGIGKSGELRLVYHNTGSGIIRPVWTVD